MENNESNLKPQSTGGLKLMTVFIVVLALHVLVIGGVTIYHLMSGGSADTDLADNKASKDAKVSSDGSVVMDAQMSDGTQPDKTTASASENATPAPAIEQTTPAETASAPAPAPTTVATAPDASTPTGPVVTPVQSPAPTPTVVEEPATAPPLEPEAPVAPAASGIYVVKMHDTLAKIAHRHHTTMAMLKKTNGLKGELLHVGERLVIPGKAEVAMAPAPAADTTGTTILSGTPATISDGTVAAPTSAPTGHRTYTVVKGDTLVRIAHKFKTTAKALMAANNITDPTKLSIGKKLRIPSREAQATTTVTPVQTPAPAAATQPVQPKVTAQLANFVQ